MEPQPAEVVAEAVAVAAEESTSAATTIASSSSSLLSGEGRGEDSGGEAPTNKTKRPAATKKRDTLPGVRRRAVVAKTIVRDESPKVVEVNADFFTQLGRTLRAVERENHQRRLAAFSIV